MKQLVLLLIVTLVVIAYLSGGAMAFNSPISPIATSKPIDPQFLTPLPTGQPGPIKQPLQQTTSIPTLTPQSTSTSIPFIPISPIIFHSPLPTPEYLCVTVGMASGYILCYEVIP